MTTIDGGGPAVLDPPDAQPAQPEENPKRRRKLLVLLVLLVFLVIVAAVFLWYLHTRKPLSELPGLDSSKLPHYQTSAYGATQPLGVAATSSGDRIYVTQTDGPRMVLVLDHDGKKLGVLRPAAKTGRMHTPIYVAVDPANGDVYVSDRATASVYVYSAKGVYLRAFTPKKSAGLKAWAPLGLAFSPSGELYVTDVTVPKQRIEVFATDGTLKRTIGAADGLSFPNGMAVDKRGNLYVSDSNNGRLLIYDKDGKMRTSIGRGVGDGALGLPRGVALDDQNRLFVVDTSDHMVRVFKVNDPSSPAFLGSFGDEGQLDGTFRFPNGVAVDGRGRVYVTDRDNNRLQVWTY